MAAEARHVAIERWLTQQCAELGAGGALPPETDVAERFGVSRMTARKAYESLVAQGVVERRRGAGTFVLPQALRRQDSLLRSFTDEILRRGMTPSSRLVDAAVGPDPALAARLGLEPDEWVVHVERVRCADGLPVALESAVLPGRLTAVVDADLQTGSLHAALSAMGERPSRAQGYVQARLATDGECALLGLEEPAALLVESRLIVDAEGVALEHTQTAYVGSRWVMDTGSFVAPSGARAT